MSTTQPRATARRRRSSPPAPSRDRNDTLHFERFELKYCVPEGVTDAIRSFAAPYVRPDPHAAGRPGGRYTIHNVYLDTPRFDSYRECRIGAARRMKLRVRWYDAAARGPFFLEVKRKVRSVIIKDRVRVTRAELDELLAHDGPSSALLRRRRDLDAFVAPMTTRGARPTIFVKYTREPYESAFGNYARITFDRSIRFQDVGSLTLPEDPRGWCYADAAWATRGVRTATILELKTTTDVPRWMSNLISEFDLQRVGFSKYATSVQHRAESGWGRLDGQRRATVGG